MRRAPLIISILALVLAATGVAVSAPRGTDGVIHACFDQAQIDNTGSSELVVINADGSCQRPGSDHPDPLTWNATGPTGATGATGPAGAGGPAGPPGQVAPVQPLPKTEVEKVDLSEKKLESAKDKLGDAVEKAKDTKGPATSAEITRFMTAVQQMVDTIVSAQTISLTALRALPASAARDQSIRQAGAQIAAAKLLLVKVAGLLKDKKLTAKELESLYTALPSLLNALAASQSSLNDGLAGRLPELIKPPSTKKP